MLELRLWVELGLWLELGQREREREKEKKDLANGALERAIGENWRNPIEQIKKDG